MVYTDLNDLNLNTNYKPKEVGIIEFNTIIADLQLYVNTLKNNQIAIKDSLGTNVSFVISDEEPTDPNVELWIQILD